MSERLERKKKKNSVRALRLLLLAGLWLLFAEQHKSAISFKKKKLLQQMYKDSLLWLTG